MPDGDSRNPFVRFKHYVDRHIAAGLQKVLGIPSVVSETFVIDNKHNNNRPPSTTTTTTTATTSLNTKNTMAEGDDNNNIPSWPTSEDGAALTKNQLAKFEGSSGELDGILDSYRGLTSAESEVGWKLFLTRSPYSPILLDHHLGWQPVPRVMVDGDSPRGVRAPVAAASGWTDCFEDLLRASSAMPMKTPSELMAPRIGATGLSFKKSETARQAQIFLDGLRRNRLDEVLFPYYSSETQYRSPRTMREWVARREEDLQNSHSPGRGDGDDLDLDLEVQVKMWMQSANKVVEDSIADWEALMSITRQIMQPILSILDGEGFESNPNGKKQDRDRDRDHDQEHQQTEEDTYQATNYNNNSNNTTAHEDRMKKLQDLYKRAFEESEKQWHKSSNDNNNKLAIASSSHDDNDNIDDAAPPGKWKLTSSETQTTPLADGTSTTVSRKVFVDEHGAVHVVKEATTRNARGEEVSTWQSRSTRREYQYQSHPGHAKPDENTGGGGEDSKREEGKKSGRGGWFWNG